MRYTCRVAPFGVIFVCAAMSLTAGSASLAAEQGARITTYLSGLNAPRGLAVDEQGSLYVAESGAAGAGPVGLTQSGRVTKYSPGSARPEWSSRFESFYEGFDPSQVQVLGPEGLSVLGEGCGGAAWEHESGHPGDHHRDDCQLRMIMSESRNGIAAESGGQINAAQAGFLFSLDPATGRATRISDVGNQIYQWTSDHQALFPDFPDANPYGVLLVRRHGRSQGTRTFVVDAGANTVSEVLANGAVRVVAYIPNETTPPFRDATPTCIAQGPDGMLYVATLRLFANLFFYGSGQSDVWRIDPDASYPTIPTLWAQGLTTPTACMFDRSGDFWAAEMFQPNAGGPPGDVVRIPFRHPEALDRMGGGALPLPGGIAQGRDGAVYISINSTGSGTGAVVRLDRIHHSCD